METIKVYISGPISGHSFEEVEKAFADGASIVSESVRPCFYKGLDVEVINPLNNGLQKNAPYNDHLVADIALLLQCDAVLMLRGWEFSQGAQVEHFIANTYGKKVVFVSE